MERVAKASRSPKAKAKARPTRKGRPKARAKVNPKGPKEKAKAASVAANDAGRSSPLPECSQHSEVFRKALVPDLSGCHWKLATDAECNPGLVALGCYLHRILPFRVSGGEPHKLEELLDKLTPLLSKAEQETKTSRKRHKLFSGLSNIYC